MKKVNIIFLYTLLIFSGMFVSCSQELEDLSDVGLESLSYETQLHPDYFETVKNTKVETHFLQNDVIPPCSEITVLIVALPENGNMQLDSMGYYYVPNINFVGEDLFTYSVTCADEQISHYEEVTIAVTEN